MELTLNELKIIRNALNKKLRTVRLQSPEFDDIKKSLYKVNTEIERIEYDIKQKARDEAFKAISNILKPKKELQMIRLFQKANELGLLDKIRMAIFILESEGSSKNDIKITTSFVTKRLIEEEIQNVSSLNLEKHEGLNKIFGVDISFDHFSNDIVIYDKANACIDEKFKIVLGF